MFARRIQLIAILLFVLFLGAPGAYSTAQDFANVQIQTTKVTDNVFMLMGAGGNIGISAGKDCVLMIDTSYAPLTDKIKAAIATVSSKPIQFIVNTHWHQDHTGGNENFAKSGAILLAHENVRKRLSTDQYIEFLKKTISPLPAPALPVITFNEHVTFHLNGDEIYIFHIDKVHTDGDAIVHFKNSNVIHMGDIYFNGMYPFIDLSAGGSINGMIAAVQRILTLCDDNTKIIPGHGPLSDRTGLEAYRKMLTAVRDRINREINAGKNLDAVIASRPTRDFDPAWGNGFLKPDLFVRIVYDSLMKEKSQAQYHRKIELAQ
ncbi:MAG TPA: MBL fold metallo-hydrolase [Syntrophales bacterium]|nr:MBL fold metallo-hydrolase [Syntrophales bacterium]